MEIFSSKHKEYKQKESSPATKIRSNIIGYVSTRGNIEIVEKNVSKRIQNQLFEFDEKPIKFREYATSLINAARPYVKLKPKKVRGRRKNKKMIKNMRVKWIDRFTSNRKAFIIFAQFFKTNKNSKFVIKIESQFEAIHSNYNKRSQPGVALLPMISKTEQLHKTAYKFKPYKWAKSVKTKAYNKKIKNKKKLI